MPAGLRAGQRTADCLQRLTDLGMRGWAAVLLCTVQQHGEHCHCSSTGRAAHDRLDLHSAVQDAGSG